MKAKRLLCLVAAAAAMASASIPAASASEYRGIPLGFDTEALAMALIEAQTGAVLESQNADSPLPMASTTKIMTALVVLENCALDELVEVGSAAVGVEGSSIYLALGERVSVRDLLYGLMLASGNDAAVALACHTAGSAEDFAMLMNEKARKLGLSSTHFVTPNGLTAPGHHTTAYELCLIAREALKNEYFREIVSTRYYTTTTGDHPRTFKNKNSLLWDYEGAVGVKTGYTEAAGRCLVFAAEREGMTVIGVLLNCRPMFEKAALLLDLAFDNYALCPVILPGVPLTNIKIENSMQSILAVGAKNSIMTVMQKDESACFSAKVRLLPVTAPVARGQTVGEIIVYRDGEPVGGSELVALEPAEARGLSYWFSVLTALFVA